MRIAPAAAADIPFAPRLALSGGYTTIVQLQAADLDGDGDRDLVGAARQSLADPDWWLKAELGCGDQVRRCVFTNYCEGLDQKHKQVTCQLWDRKGLNEPGIRKTRDGKRRLIPAVWHPEYDPDDLNPEEMPAR